MIKRFFDRVTASFSLLAGVALVFMLLQISVDVFSKYLFNTPLLWTMDVVASYMMVAIVFIPLAEVERENSHIRVELLTQGLSSLWHRIVIIFSTLISIFYFTLLTWQTWLDAVDKYKIGEYVMGEAQVTVWPGRFFLPIGYGALLLLLLYKLWCYLTDKNFHETETKSASGEHFDE
ncbi:TRAP transporter small permease [Sneathiella sp.]|uniref:TRAP transporter small permease n=1 Tax=Sneathiella sp. TaxID=1964365 RepID=UPI0026042520|nr:TRAP transporter small permease [Sneathiella sp.]MDF2368523.1 TRAP transporter small permease [Sneathiella sp.]